MRTTEKINELMNYLTSVTVNDITEKENEIIFDCEIISQPKKRCKFNIYKKKKPVNIDNLYILSCSFHVQIRYSKR